MNRTLGCALLSIALSLTVCAADNGPWIEVHTPNFRVISNGSGRQAREVALGFEQMRAIFPKVLNNVRTDSGEEMIIFAVRDEHTMQALLPAMWKAKGGVHPAGVFLGGWEKDFAVVRLDVQDAAEVAYHEYIHKLTRLNLPRLPVWLNEGMAEFFANSRIESRRVLVGTPSLRLRDARLQTLIPLPEFLAAGPSSPLYRQESRAATFYAESWALTHFLMFSDGMGNGEKFAMYLRKVSQGGNSISAFKEVFGDPAAIEQRFFQYTHLVAFRSFVVNTQLDADSKEFEVRKLPVPEIDATIGILYDASGQPELARKALKSALAADANSWIVHENLGLLAINDGADDAAAEHFATAIRLNAKTYLSQYYASMLSSRQSASTDSLKTIVAGCDAVLAINPYFAPAEVQRSIAFLRLGRNAEAANASGHAVQLEPDRAGYRINQAEIALAQNDVDSAVTIAADVVGRWQGPDATEAFELLQRACSTTKSPPGACSQIKLPEHAVNLEAVRGVITSVKCTEGRPQELQLRAKDAVLTFDLTHVIGLGWSDTFWFGSDHMRICTRTLGSTVVVRYKAGSTEAKWVELRNEPHPRVGK